MKVIEIFDSIDGEGIRTGQCATFIRLAGCNLRCSYCDTVYSLFGEETPCEYTEMTIWVYLTLFTTKHLLVITAYSAKAADTVRHARSEDAVTNNIWR